MAQTTLSFVTCKNKDHRFQIGKEEEKLSLLTELINEFNKVRGTRSIYENQLYLNTAEMNCLEMKFRKQFRL